MAKPTFIFSITAELKKFTEDEMVIGGESSLTFFGEVTPGEVDEIVIAVIEKIAGELQKHIDDAMRNKMSIS